MLVVGTRSLVHLNGSKTNTLIARMHRHTFGGRPRGTRIASTRLVKKDMCSCNQESDCGARRSKKASVGCNHFLSRLN